MVELTADVRAGFLSRISTGSTLAELPGYEASLEISDRAKKAGDFFHSHPEVPGLLLTEGGRFRTVLSRRYYHDVVGRYCGMDLYHPRPLGFMMSRLEELGGALVLPGELRVGEAVRRGLERPRALVYEPLVVELTDDGRAGAGVRLIDFEDLLAADARVTLLRSEQMKQILATVREGLLLIDRQHRIGLEYAGSAEAILEIGALAGHKLPEVLAARLDPERTQLAADYLDMLFDPRIIESLITKINPLLKVEARFPQGRRKTLAFRFVRGLEGGAIRHVLVRIEDLTREEELARELEAQRQRGEQHLELAVALMQADPEALVGLLDRLDPQLRRAEAFFGPRPAAAPTPAAFDALLRDLHAAKGEASLLGFAPLAREIHQLEDALAGVRRGEPDAGAAKAAAAARIASATTLLAAARSVVEQLARFGRTVRNGEAATRQTQTAPAPSAAGHSEGVPSVSTELQTVEAALERFVSDLAAELGKPARFLWRAGGVTIPYRYSRVVREALVQLARNALVHGVESPEVRRLRGKPAVAALQLAARQRPGSGAIELIFQDDGGGLDLAALRARAGQLGRKVGSDEELRRLIFLPGFSTASRTTLHAGRGIGLDLIRDRIESVGGRIAVHSEPGRFCAFQILLPLEPPS
ncbi:MAG TPA: ATP-binding protein [Thermoanaerobaculia bacterium]|jgi:HPt (histidine-containing phosphotransfer) domain-containing protein|nr:ATP-binding protein [Thermoanaerobaculia bacterium]